MTCTDAPHLLKLRREIAANPHLSMPIINELLRATNEIRWQHEEASPDCGCWHKARAAAEQGEQA